MATLCYGNIVNGNNGHDETDVLYLAFTGADAVPGANGAKWNAQNAVEFEASLATLGDKLVKRIAGGGSDTTLTTTTKSISTTTSKVPTATCTPCSWTGHCAGDNCFTSSTPSSSSSSSISSSSTSSYSTTVSSPSSSPSISSSSSLKPSSSVSSSATCCPKPTTSHSGANSNSRSHKPKKQN